MHIITFTYREKEYTGYIASSTIAEPHFHWLFFTDQALTEVIGDDSIAFQENDGRLINYNRIPLAHQDLVHIAQQHIEAYLNNGKGNHK